MPLSGRHGPLRPFGLPVIQTVGTYRGRVMDIERKMQLSGITSATTKYIRRSTSTYILYGKPQNLFNILINTSLLRSGRKELYLLKPEFWVSIYDLVFNKLVPNSPTSHVLLIL